MSQAALRLALLAVALLAGACDGGTSAPPSDDLRIVSLAPHLTEMIYTVGAEAALVGVVAFSDYPPEAQALPVVGDAFRVDFERLTQVAPTLILAWEGGNPATLIDDLRERGYRVAALASGGLENIAENVREIGRLTGRENQANKAARDYLDGLAALRAQRRDARRLRVFFQIGAHPLYTVTDAHTIGQIVALCGGQNLFARLPGLSAAVNVEAVIAADPDVLMASGPIASLVLWRRYAEMRAVKADQLYGITADHIARDSTRLLLGAQEVCARLDEAR